MHQNFIGGCFHAVRQMFKRFATVQLALLTFTVFSFCSAGVDSATQKWVGTWSTAPQLVETGNNPPAPGLSNNTLRQILRVSLGGDSLRLRLSNEFSTSPVTVHAIHIALSNGGGAIDTTTDLGLFFNGKTEFTIPAGGAMTSDPFHFTVQPRTDVAITIYYGSTSASITGHPGSRTTSYLLAGNQISKVDFSGAALPEHWYNINTIDVLAPQTAACVTILGNSITDGRGSITNLQNRWPDIFSEALLKNPKTQHVGVLNQGIGGNCVLAGGLGPTGVSRFDRDIINQQAVRWAIVFEGVNDIGGVNSASGATSKTAALIAAFQQMIVKAHAKNITIYGATIMPFKGNSYYNQYSEQCRNAVNQWIRTPGNYDGCIDFDKVMRNPLDTLSLVSSNQNDGLHPDAAGHVKMGQSIDLNLFTTPDTTTLGVHSITPIGGYVLGQNFPNPFNPSTNISFTIPSRSFVSLTIFNMLGKAVATLVSEAKSAGTYSQEWNAADFPSGVYFYRLRAGSFTETKQLILLK
jgi:lysophospholipase L1-like esterase